jgi:hypothetical protein
MQTIQIPEVLYRRLSERAARLHLSPEQLIEQLLASPSGDGDLLMPPAGSEDALAAVARLSGLFGDLTRPNLDATLTDPMLALANADLNDLER